jgi:uncharacterized membrane protein YcaP (DUF421 family)
MNWSAMFIPSSSLLEVMVRGTAMYLLIFLMMRLLPRRQMGSLGVADLLVIMLVADAAQNGMTGEYRSITEGIVLVATIFFWDYVIDWIDFRFPALQLSGPPSVVLVRNGRILRRVLRRQHMSEDDLMSQLRVHGVDDIHRVTKAVLEGDGRISVIRGDAASAASSANVSGR